MRPPVHLDFVAPRARAPRAGAVLLLLGAVSVAAALYAYRTALAHREGLELRRAAVLRLVHRRSAGLAVAALDAAVAGSAARELLVPWTQLLADLEAASRDSKDEVSVLAVEPDLAKHDVHITGESKDLERAIAYVERLQSARSLKYPMLDRHELRSDDPQHPVRFELTGEWSERP